MSGFARGGRARTIDLDPDDYSKGGSPGSPGSPWRQIDDD
jgi:hypothetical protein